MPKSERNPHATEPERAGASPADPSAGPRSREAATRPPHRRSVLSGLTALTGALCAAGTSLACRAAEPGRKRARRPQDAPPPAWPELSDQRASVEPISPEERSARRTRLGRLLSQRGIDAYFCEGGATLDYLAGVSWGRSERSFGLLVLADGSHHWICPRFETEKADLKIRQSGAGGQLVTWHEDEYARHAFAELIEERGIQRLAIDPDTRLLVHDEVHLAGLAHADILSGRGVLVALRGVKDAHELQLLRKANELTQRAIVAASERLRPGMSNAEVADLMRSAQQALGLERVWVLALIGPSAAYPHGDDGDARLSKGDFLLVDTGGSLHGYQSDNTRTWVPHGKPGARQTEVWNTVRDAQRRAFETIRPGVSCATVDLAAREVIDRAGFGPDYRTFTHRLGHGIGMQGHEDPYFDRGSEVVLEPGMTLSNEPGIYLYGEFGVRLEDIVVVTETGADHFGGWQADPRSPATEAR